MSDGFTWIPFFEELARELLKWRERQAELITFLEELRETGLPITGLTDRDAQGARALLEEIDPFTFLGVINRGITDQARIQVASAMKEYFKLRAPVPRDFDGVPTLVPMSSWFITFKADRGTHDVDNLWRLLELALSESPLEDETFFEALDLVLGQPRVNINVTMALFWVRPDMFLSLDRHTRTFLGTKLPPGGLTAEFYRQTLVRMRESGRTPESVSHDAWLASKQSLKPEVKVDIEPEGTNHWLVGAYWDGVDPPDQTPRFIAEGIWENGYEDKYLEEVKSIAVGDKIAIKAATTQKHGHPFDSRGRTVSRLIIKAVGTVIKNLGDGRRLEVEWDPEYQPRDWYFFTNRSTVWRLRTDAAYRHREFAARLVDFVWYGADQDLSWFVDAWYGVDQPTQVDDGPSEVDTTPPYGPEDVLADGAFLDLAEVEDIVERIRSRKAVILQGPPGVGKTFLARRLGFAVMEERSDDRIRMVQFHQSYSYEDFIRGYRPRTDKAGAFALRNGIFFEFCEAARQDPDHSYVFIIDEINRGNLSQIFGEALMLIESDKRRPEYALPLVYREEGEPDFYVPSNVYLIGLMNVADRSLAMLDYALRRRFAFIDLAPRVQHPSFARWLRDRKMADDLVDLIVTRLSNLNATIAADQHLGPNYLVGHSFFTPRGEDFSQLDSSWYQSIVRTEIAPLLREYWYDDLAEAEKAIGALQAP